MGPANQPSSNTDNHKDYQIPDLELQLAAHAARASKLHARLMATLDTLDSERRACAEEISDERRQRVTLHAQLRVARAEAAAMEVERDSLREGVLHLVEKVEVCNDYSLWPHSGLATTSLATSSNPRHLHEQPQSTWTASARAYSAALITALRDECERERRARSDSLRRIAELEAQLAHREAELEERYDVAPVPTVHSPLPRLSRDGAIRVLQQSAARNQALTHEIANLVHRLEDAQAELEQSPSSSPVLTTPPRRRRASSPVSPTPKRHPSPPPLPLRFSQDSSPISGPRRLQGSPSPPLLSRRVPLSPTDIARQIAVVARDLAGLRAEEQCLLRAGAQPGTVQSRERDQDVPPIDAITSRHTFQRILLVEEECIRLRAELAASTTREAALRELLGSVPPLAPLPTEKDVFGGDEGDGEPMDLATPLQPTVLLDPDDL